MGISDVAYLSNAIVKAKKGGQDIGDYGFVLSDYEKESKMNAYAIMAAIEFVKKAYSPDLAGSPTLGHGLAAARNLGIDIIESSDFLKFNFFNFASGTVLHPAKYQWKSD